MNILTENKSKNTTRKEVERSSTVSKGTTPKANDKNIPLTGSVSKAKKPLWRQRFNSNQSGVTTPKAEPKQTSNMVPKGSPKPKQNRPLPSESAKKPAWKRRPKPAHSGVPIPEKMKQLLQKQFNSLNDSLINE